MRDAENMQNEKLSLLGDSDALALKGVHFLERSEVVRFSLPPGNIHTHRREAAIPSPLNPMNLLNPLNSATQWLHGRYLPLCTF